MQTPAAWAYRLSSYFFASLKNSSAAIQPANGSDLLFNTQPIAVRQWSAIYKTDSYTRFEALKQKSQCFDDTMACRTSMLVAFFSTIAIKGPQFMHRGCMRKSNH
jgi:hypothetical protein